MTFAILRWAPRDFRVSATLDDQPSSRRRTAVMKTFQAASHGTSAEIGCRESERGAGEHHGVRTPCVEPGELACDRAAGDGESVRGETRWRQAETARQTPGSLPWIPGSVELRADCKASTGCGPAICGKNYVRPRLTERFKVPLAASSRPMRRISASPRSSACSLVCTE
jgi:hypothetical protein